MFRWTPPQEGWRPSYAQVLPAVQSWMLPIVLDSPEQKRGENCGPYCLMALYFLSWKDRKVRKVVDKDTAHRLLLENAFTDADGDVLVDMLARTISECVASEQSSTKGEKGESAKPAQLPVAWDLDQHFDFPFRSRESRNAKAPMSEASGGTGGGNSH